MKKNLITLVILGLLISGTTALAEGIAVVDVQKVVMNSAKVKKLETDRIKQEQDLQKFITNAKKAIDAEKNADKKKDLELKYNKELSQKLSTQRKDTMDRTLGIEKDILVVIEKEAKALGYDMVIQKSSVLYGGNDITEEIIKHVK
jgi:outer membrane protein